MSSFYFSAFVYTYCLSYYQYFSFLWSLLYLLKYLIPGWVITLILYLLSWILLCFMKISRICTSCQLTHTYSVSETLWTIAPMYIILITFQKPFFFFLEKLNGIEHLINTTFISFFFNYSSLFLEVHSFFLYFFPSRLSFKLKAWI